MEAYDYFVICEDERLLSRLDFLSFLDFFIASLCYLFTVVIIIIIKNEIHLYIQKHKFNLIKLIKRDKVELYLYLSLFLLFNAIFIITISLNLFKYLDLHLTL